MGKKPFGKRMLRLDKAQRVHISSGSTGSGGGDGSAQKKQKKPKKTKATAPGSGECFPIDAGAQIHAIKRITQTGMAGPRRIGPYSNRQRILLVGEGDFSFSLSLAAAIGGSNLVCTSLDKLTQLQVPYLPDAAPPLV